MTVISRGQSGLAEWSKVLGYHPEVLGLISSKILGKISEIIKISGIHQRCTGYNLGYRGVLVRNPLCISAIHGTLFKESRVPFAKS